MKQTALTFILAIQTLSSPLWASSEASLTGLPYQSQIHFDIERICIAGNPFVTEKAYAGLVEPALEVGAFRAAFKLDSEELIMNASALEDYRRLPFQELAKQVKKGAYGSKDFLFENFRFSLPMESLELAIGGLRYPDSGSFMTDLVDAATGRAEQEIIPALGFYLKFDNVKSLVAFDGRNSHIATPLWAQDKDANYFYEKLWPQVAVMLNRSRTLVSQKQGQEDYRLNPDCLDQSFIRYSVKIE